MLFGLHLARSRGTVWEQLSATLWWLCLGGDLWICVGFQCATDWGSECSTSACVWMLFYYAEPFWIKCSPSRCHADVIIILPNHQLIKVTSRKSSCRRRELAIFSFPAGMLLRSATAAWLRFPRATVLAAIHWLYQCLNLPFCNNFFSAPMCVPSIVCVCVRLECFDVILWNVYRAS